MNGKTGIVPEISSCLVSVSADYSDIVFGVCRTSYDNGVPCCIHILNNRDICEYDDSLFDCLEDRVNIELSDFYREDGLDIFPPDSGGVSSFMGFALDLSLILKNCKFYRVINVDQIKSMYARKLSDCLGRDYTKEDVCG